MSPLNPNIWTLVLASCVLELSVHAVVCAPHCLSGDFHSQLQHILDTQMMSKHEQSDIIARILHDARSTLNKRWRGYKIFPFGSLVTGLATKASDVDFYVQLPHFNSSSGLHVVKETKNLFKKQPALYSHVIYFSKVDYAATQFFHIPSQRTVDLVFTFGDMAVANSNFIKYYMNLDKRFLPLTAFLKYWFKIQRESGEHVPRDYVLYLLIIFYLQHKNMAPPVYILQINTKPQLIDDWDVSFTEIPYSSKNREDIYQLLGGFFKYYSQFNFDEYLVSTFGGRPIKKNAFKKIENFPKEYSLYPNDLRKKLQHRIQHNLDTHSAVCVQDVFVHDENVVERVSRHKDAKKFKHLMKRVAKMFEDLPRDELLRALLVDGEGKEKHCCNK